MTEDEQARRAAEAARLLENETLKEAFAAIRERQVQHFIGSELSQTERREQAFKIMKATDEVWHQLKNWLTEGKIIEDRRKIRGKPVDF